MDVFGRLAPYIQDYIYRNRWTELREVQLAACDVIFNTDHNLLLSTGTASGKTEAAFLPALTLLHEKPSASVGILYISPLKALINDQFVRMNLLLEKGGIPVCQWHGDSPISAKKRLIEKPQGVLQITPESLESMLMNKPEVCIRLFSDLRFVIIDEVHYFMGSFRGIQLLCLLERIQKLVGKESPPQQGKSPSPAFGGKLRSAESVEPRRIGLSATLADYSSAENWLNSGTTRKCTTPVVDTGKRMLGLSMQRFVLQHKESPPHLRSAESETKDTIDLGQAAHYRYLYQQTRHKKSIIFARSRAETELIISNIKEIAKASHTKDIYRIHHGGIVPSERQKVEQDMKMSDGPIVTGATVTLELGMDIGSLDMVVQVGSPHSVSSFVQRIGRCGRRGQPAQLLFTFVEGETDTNAKWLEAVNWDFIKTIAIIQLFLEERWIEPVSPKHHPYTMLYHQTMCYLASAGEVAPPVLAQNVLGLSVFKKITQEDYRLMLKHLLQTGQLLKTERGGIIIGTKAGKMVSYFDFFSVFESAGEYQVKVGNRVIGTVMESYPKGTRLTLAGQTWESLGTDEVLKIIQVKTVDGVSKINWSVQAEADFHTKLLRKMRDIFICDDEYAYMSEDCKARLAQIRGIVRKAGMAENYIIPLWDGTYAIFPWLGTRQLTALLLALNEKGVRCTIQPGKSNSIYLQANFDGTKEQLEEIICGICNSELDKYKLKLPPDTQIPGKYNKFVPKELLAKQFIEDYIDVDGMKRDLSEMIFV